MTLTYIFHSGFVLETEQSILVFDYWLDPNGVMGGVLKKNKPLYVCIFHAGDLNNWYAKFLPDVMPGETIYSEEFEEEIDPIAHEKQYLGELKDIRKVTDSFDVVMFPIDGRIGNGYTLGGRQFIERFKVGMFVPMHFVASGFEVTEQREPSSSLEWPSRDKKSTFVNYWLQR